MKNTRIITGTDIDLPVLRCMGFYNINSVQSIEEHQHKAIELIYVLSGQHNLTFEKNQTATVTGGHFCIIPNNYPHRLVDGIVTPGHLVWLQLKPIESCSFDNSCLSRNEYGVIYNSLKSDKIAVHKISKKSETIIGWLSHFLRNTEIDNTPLACAELRTIIFQLLIDTQNRFEIEENEICFPIEEIKEYVNQNISANISLSEIAEYVGYNITWLQKRFKAATGTKLGAYIQKTRMDLAKTLLRQTNENIIVIAGHCGFNSSQYFATTFQKHTNMTPTQYRSTQFSSEKLEDMESKNEQ